MLHRAWHNIAMKTHTYSDAVHKIALVLFSGGQDSTTCLAQALSKYERVETVSFRALNQLNLKTSRAWAIKENFTQFWSYSYKGAAKRFFDAWFNNAMRSRLESIKKVVKMLRRHDTGLLNNSQHRISNACAEGFNSAIQLIKANARGFRNFTNYRARILFHCGKLDLGWA